VKIMDKIDKMDVHKETYREEAYELLAELEETLLELEEDSGNMDLISRVFRALHTLKGSGAMFGFDNIASFTHDVENVFELVRNGVLHITKDLIDIVLASGDYVKDMLDASASDDVFDEEVGQKILERLKVFLSEQKVDTNAITSAPQSAPTPTPTPASTTASTTASTIEDEDYEPASDSVFQQSDSSGQEVTYRILFKPDKSIFKAGVNITYLLEDVQSLGKAYVLAHLGPIPTLQEMSPEDCYTYWDIILTTDKGDKAIRDTFIFVEDLSELQVDVIDEGGLVIEETDYKKLGEILVERGTLSKKDLQSVIEAQSRLGEVLVQKGLANARDVESALVEQKHVKDIRTERYARDMAKTIRVPSERLDSLVDLVGELVTVQARLTQHAGERRSDSTLLSISEEVERLSAELHDNTMSIRMLPIGGTFTKFKRLVRTLSTELGRDVQLITSGAETELDKSVIEKLNDPLVHLIRNCVGHGIESPALREAVGKTSMGTVNLRAEHSGADVIISISDDGAGIDLTAVRAKAIEKGIIHHDADLTKHEILNLIFAPGFTTAASVTGVSGRGVGMDVVKRNIESLRGTVELDSTKGIGTTITLKLPLTLAIIDGLMVRIGGDHFVIPLLSVEECVELRYRETEGEAGRSLINVRGEMIPYIKLRDRFAVPGERPELEQVVILETNDIKVGFAVDKVVGEHQTVIKSLSRVYRNVKGISGATILGNGSVALILDIPQLVTDEVVEENARVEDM
jgi:two-component system chemotaxis sensor kinase CheA